MSSSMRLTDVGRGESDPPVDAGDGGDRVPPLGSASDANASYTERASLPKGEAFKH